MNLPGRTQGAVGEVVSAKGSGRLAWAGVALAAVLPLTGCSSGHHTNSVDPVARVIVPGGARPYSTGVRSASPNSPYTFGSLMVCALRPPSPVRITSVSLTGQHGLAVVGFATRPNPFMSNPPQLAVGSEKGSVTDHHLRGNSVARCLPPRPGTEGLLTAPTEVIVSVRRTGPDTGTAPGVVIHYDVGDKRGTASFPFGFTLCSAKDTTTNGCH
jgi:hypothetical protein